MIAEMRWDAPGVRSNYGVSERTHQKGTWHWGNSRREDPQGSQGERHTSPAFQLHQRKWRLNVDKGMQLSQGEPWYSEVSPPPIYRILALSTLCMGSESFWTSYLIALWIVGHTTLSRWERRDVEGFQLPCPRPREILCVCHHLCSQIGFQIYE